MKILRNIMVLGAVAAVLSSCSENEYKVYDTTQKDSVFFNYVNDRNEVVSTYDYAFNFDINNHYVLSIPVSVMGSIKSYDRPVNVCLDDEESTMIEGTHFNILEASIPAGATEGVVKIDLLRDRDPKLLTEAVTGRFYIGENDDLRSVKGSEFTVTYSDIRPESRPAWWLEGTTTQFPVYSFENAQLFFDYFYRLAPEANIDWFNEIIETYGDYFVNAGQTQGPFTMYTQFLRKYVCIPLHEDHPEVEFYKDPTL